MIETPRARRRLMTLLAGLLVAAAPAIGSAQVVYNNGTPDNSFGLNIMQPYTTANDFQLLGTTQLLWFDWYAMMEGTNGPSTVTADFYWQILSDQGGLPGSLLARGSVTGATGTLTDFGCCKPQPWEFQSYRFSTSLNSVTLGGGTYWLAIGGFSSDRDNEFYYWHNSAHEDGNGAKRWTGTEWRTYDVEGAFTMYGTPGQDVNVVPEPASLILLATGLGGLGGFRFVRRRKKSEAQAVNG